ncbi:hypothetical protein A9G29_02095 [Gilliamella sp. Fer2-1]|nr:hypothetical protein A9G29_02095 [Gilliamella apicola]
MEKSANLSYLNHGGHFYNYPDVKKSTSVKAIQRGVMVSRFEIAMPSDRKSILVIIIVFASKYLAIAPQAMLKLYRRN